MPIVDAAWLAIVLGVAVTQAKGGAAIRSRWVLLLGDGRVHAGVPWR